MKGVPPKVEFNPSAIDIEVENVKLPPIVDCVFVARNGVSDECVNPEG